MVNPRQAGRKRMNMDEIAKDAYLAGIVDGEGCIGIYKEHDKRPGRRTYYRVSIIVVQKDPTIPLWIYENYGGKLDMVTRTKGYSPGHYARWVANGTTAYHIMKRIRPYVILKRNKLEHALKIQEHIMLYKYKHLKCKNSERGKVLEKIHKERDQLFEIYRAAAETEREGELFNRVRSDSPVLQDGKL